MRKVMNFVAASLVVITCMTAFLLLYLPNLHAIALQKRAIEEESGQKGYSVLALLLDNTEKRKDVIDSLPDNAQFRLELPAGVELSDIKINSEPLTGVVEIKIPGIGSDYFYTYPMIGRADHITEMTYDSDGDEGIIDIWVDKIYELKTYQQNQYVYIEFIDLHDIYDYVVVVDAGHGGKAPGASKQGINEKDIDLAVLLQLKEMLDETDKNIKVFYTRTDDSNPSLASRVNLANNSDADLFLSIHNNSTASGRMSSINGTEVLYHVEDGNGKSKEFATICLNSLLDSLGSKSKGVVAGDEIYIIRTANMPVALVEIGFMTNKQELFLLNSEDYQKKAAEGLYNAIMTSLDEVCTSEEDTNE